MSQKRGFQETLKEQKATLGQVVELFPEIKTVKEGQRTRLFLGDDAPPPPPSDTLDAFAT